MDADMDYMRKAYRLALKGKGETSPNPMVGSVIVKGHKIIAEGWHRRCGAPHAEINALKNAPGLLHQAKMYVTLEPCFHYGRTPPCVDAIIQSGIKEVIIGMRDPDPRTDGKSMAKLKRAGIKTKVGLLQEELSQMNEAFIKYARTRMPFVAVKCAQSLDGKIATASGRSKWITSQSARRFARKIRNEYDAILTGITTVLRDDPALTGSQKSKRIKKVILDSSLRIPLKAKLFSGSTPADCIVATTKSAPKKKRSGLIAKGISVIECPEKNGGIDLKWLLKYLAKHEITSVLIEGGAHVIGSALRQGLVDKVYMYIAPKFIGDQKALNSVVGLNTTNVQRMPGLKTYTVRQVGRDILVVGYV